MEISASVRNCAAVQAVPVRAGALSQPLSQPLNQPLGQPLAVAAKAVGCGSAIGGGELPASR